MPMKYTAYLQTSESVGEVELDVQFPDPTDGTLIIPIDFNDVVRTYVALLDTGENDTQMWVRVIPEGL